MKLLSPVLFYISLTTRPIFLGPLCVALLQNWDFLPWLLRKRYCCWTDWVFFWEDHAFSYKLGCLIHSTLSLMFFHRLVFDGAVISRVVLHLFDTSLTFFGANNTCSSALQLRCSTLVTKTAILLLDWLGLLLRRPWVQLQTWLLNPFNFVIDFFYRLVFDGAVIFRVVSLLVDTSSPFLGPTIRVALLHNWDFLPWLLRQSDIVAGLIGSSSEKTMRSVTNMVVCSLQHSHCFFTG